MVILPFEQMLAQCGFELAAAPLRVMFEMENVTDPRLQYELARDIVERTMSALEVLTRTKTVH